MWQTMGVTLLVLLLSLLWFFFTPRVALRTRLSCFVLLILLGFGMKHSLRVDGTLNGKGLPRLAWKWSAPSVPALNGKPMPVADGSIVADKQRLAASASSRNRGE